MYVIKSMKPITTKLYGALITIQEDFLFQLPFSTAIKIVGCLYVEFLYSCQVFRQENNKKIWKKKFSTQENLENIFFFSDLHNENTKLFPAQHWLNKL